MPATSKARTPIRLVATPRRTPRRGSTCLVKNSSSALASAGTERTSPPATTPAGRSPRRGVEQWGRAVVGDTRCSELGRADLETHELAFGLARTTPRLLSVG